MSLPTGVVNISSIDAFNRLVNTYKEALILVDFYADWCVPCKQFHPIYKKTAERYIGKGILFTRINSEEFPEVSEQFAITGIPTLILIRNKKGLKKQVGALNSHQLKQLIEQFK